MNYSQAWTAIAGLLVVASMSLGDQVQLANGDSLRGKVLKLDEKTLTFQSESLGELKIDREKIAAIHLGDRPVASPASEPAPKETSASKSPEALIADLLKKSGPSGQKPVGKNADPREQLKDPAVAGAVGEVQKMFPLLATPEAGGYFKDALGGLMSGKLNVKDIRKDAIKARDMIDDLRKELGPQADALNGYRSILESFIQETEE